MTEQNKINLPVSIVIPSIGEPTLEKVFNAFKSSKYQIDEILVIIPEEYSQPHHQNHENIKYIFTNFKGQVKQRIFGFKKAKNNIILQLDSDCYISSEDTASLYYDLIKIGPKNSIGPVYIDVNTRECIHKFRTDFVSSIKRLITYIICGAKFGKKRMGTISKVGSNYGVDPNFINERLYQSEWIPGGCAIYFKEDLILDNYFPFKGKAYCEDLIHSFHLKKNLINLWISTDSVCYTPTPVFPHTAIEIKKYLDAYKYYIDIQTSGFYVKYRFKLWFFLTMIRRMNIQVFNKR